jgi:hypothetical protein
MVAETLVSYADWLAPLFDIVNSAFYSKTRGVVDTSFL